MLLRFTSTSSSARRRLRLRLHPAALFPMSSTLSTSARDPLEELPFVQYYVVRGAECQVWSPESS